MPTRSILLRSELAQWGCPQCSAPKQRSPSAFLIRSSAYTLRIRQLLVSHTSMLTKTNSQVPLTRSSLGNEAGSNVNINEKIFPVLSKIAGRDRSTLRSLQLAKPKLNFNESETRESGECTNEESLAQTPAEEMVLLIEKNISNNQGSVIELLTADRQKICSLRFFFGLASQVQ